jgi:DNA-binding transcriptional regulator GbsR (MarR family)
MELEKVKRDFISYMEEVHGRNPYPHNLFGCLMAVLVEREPISQERIMELTGYSQATVSLTIQKIQLLLPIRTVKKKGDRRRYYVYGDAPTSFVLDLLHRRVDVQDIDPSLIESILSKVGRRVNEDKELTRFKTFLDNLKLYLSLIHENRSTSVEPFKQALAAGSLEGLDLQDASFLRKGELAEFTAKLSEITSVSEHEVPVESGPHDSLVLKNEYFTGIKTNLNPLFSQALANRLMVVHSVLLEGCTTQNRIEQTTLLPRSTISEVLSQVVERGIIEVSGLRPKLYHSAISFSDLMLASFDRVANYISSVRTRLSEFVSTAKKVRPKSMEASEFVDFLVNLENAYTLALAFSVNMKVQTVRQLREEYNRGFVFI